MPEVGHAPATIETGLCCYDCFLRELPAGAASSRTGSHRSLVNGSSIAKNPSESFAHPSISLIQRADNDGPTCFPIRRLAAELIDAQGAVDWRAAFGAPSHWFLSSAHARSLLRRFVTG